MGQLADEISEQKKRAFSIDGIDYLYIADETAGEKPGFIIGGII